MNRVSTISKILKKRRKKKASEHKEIQFLPPNVDDILAEKKEEIESEEFDLESQTFEGLSENSPLRKVFLS